MWRLHNATSIDTNRFDARDKPSLTLAVHYTDDSVFGGRAMMHIPAGEGISFSKKYRQDGKERKKGARLIIDSLRPGDAGFYKCRTDFKKSPTRNYRLNMSILSKLVTKVQSNAYFSNVSQLKYSLKLCLQWTSFRLRPGKKGAIALGKPDQLTCVVYVRTHRGE